MGDTDLLCWDNVHYTRNLSDRINWSTLLSDNQRAIANLVISGIILLPYNWYNLCPTSFPETKTDPYAVALAVRQPLAATAA